MNYENKTSLFEAVYFFNKSLCHKENKYPIKLSPHESKETKMHTSIYSAMMRILVVSEMIENKETYFFLRQDHKVKHEKIMQTILKMSSIENYHDLYDKSTRKNQFFFDHISEAEDQIYCKCNFNITYESGQVINQHIRFNKGKILELGGNSGGLATAILKENNLCEYTIVDRKIPCMIGNEYKAINDVELSFIDQDIFNLKLADNKYDYIIIMNLLHDFNDRDCQNILKNCLKYCHTKTNFIIIEDILISDYKPRDAIMYGLRLSVECQGGKQRSKDEFKDMFSKINYEIKEDIRLSNVHGMLIFNEIE
jgi:2-polyprenyl-3-methyl-5-hydroxy-6-metoxy-1,4-benzoquinol methylase